MPHAEITGLDLPFPLLLGLKVKKLTKKFLIFFYNIKT